jgi:hypothetical protein
MIVVIVILPPEIQISFKAVMPETHSENGVRDEDCTSE